MENSILESKDIAVGYSIKVPNDPTIDELKGKIAKLEKMVSNLKHSNKEETRPEKTTKLIFSYGLARFLLGKGCKMVDLHKDRDDQNKLIFVFHCDDKLRNALKEFTELRQASKKDISDFWLKLRRQAPAFRYGDVRRTKLEQL